MRCGKCSSGRWWAVEIDPGRRSCVCCFWGSEFWVSCYTRHSVYYLYGEGTSPQTCSKKGRCAVDFAKEPRLLQFLRAVNEPFPFCLSFSLSASLFLPLLLTLQMSTSTSSKNSDSCICGSSLETTNPSGFLDSLLLLYHLVGPFSQFWVCVWVFCFRISAGSSDIPGFPPYCIRGHWGGGI